MKYVALEEAERYFTINFIEKLITYIKKDDNIKILGYLKSDADSNNYVVELAHKCPSCQHSESMLVNDANYIYCPICFTIYNFVSAGLARRGTIHYSNSRYTDMCKEYIGMENKIRPSKESDYFVI